MIGELRAAFRWSTFLQRFWILFSCSRDRFSCLISLVGLEIWFLLVSLGFLEGIKGVNSSNDISFCHVYLERNCVANYLAKAGANRSNCMYSSMVGLSSEVVGSFCADMRGLPYLRYHS